MGEEHGCGTTVQIYLWVFLSQGLLIHHSPSIVHFIYWASRLHSLISLPTASILANVLISYCWGYCKIPVSGDDHFIHNIHNYFWYIVFQKYSFPNFPQQIFSFLFQIFENHQLLNKIISSLFTEPWGLL